MPSRSEIVRNVIVWPMVFSALAVGAYPAKITVDGYFYLSSSKAMWTSEFPTHYYWIREPGYPAFLRLLRAFFGTSDLVLSFAQSFLLLAPIGLLASLLVRPAGRLARLLIPLMLAFAFATPQYMGYGSIVLKQPLLVANLAVISIPVVYAYWHPTRRGFVYLLCGLGALSALSVSISITQRYMCFASAFVCALAWLRPRFQSPFRKPPLRFAFEGMFVALTLALGSLLGSSLAVSWWDGVRRDNAPAAEQNFKVDVNESGRLSAWLSNPGSSVNEAFDDFRALLMIGPTENSSGVKENELFTRIQAHPAWRCGAADEFTREPYTSFGRAGISFSCRSNVLHSFTEKFHGFGSLFYKATMLAGVSSVLILVIRRKLYRLLILGPGVVFVTVYSASGSFIVDRYGLPFYPFALAASFALLCDMSEGIMHLKRRRTQKTDAVLKNMYGCEVSSSPAEGSCESRT